MNLAQKINELQKKYGDSFFWVYINNLNGKTLEELYFLKYRIIKLTTPDYFQYLVVNRRNTEIIAEGDIFTKENI